MIHVHKQRNDKGITKIIINIMRRPLSVILGMFWLSLSSQNASQYVPRVKIGIQSQIMILQPHLQQPLHYDKSEHDRIEQLRHV